MSIDRKELTRQYKESPRAAGIAVARCLANGKVFVFGGKDIPALINRHRAQLRFGGHPNKALQHDWSSLGADQFTVEIVDTLVPPDESPLHDFTDDVRALELLWMEKLAPYEPAGYHRAPKTE